MNLQTRKYVLSRAVSGRSGISISTHMMNLLVGNRAVVLQDVIVGGPGCIYELLQCRL